MKKAISIFSLALMLGAVPAAFAALPGSRALTWG